MSQPVIPTVTIKESTFAGEELVVDKVLYFSPHPKPYAPPNLYRLWRNDKRLEFHAFEVDATAYLAFMDAYKAALSRWFLVEHQAAIEQTNGPFQTIIHYYDIPLQGRKGFCAYFYKDGVLESFTRVSKVELVVSIMGEAITRMLPHAWVPYQFSEGFEPFGLTPYNETQEEKI